MLAYYEAPALTLYGNVTAFTNSAKCSPGGDAALAGTRGAAPADEDNATVPYPSGTVVFYNSDGSKVRTGTECFSGDGFGDLFTAG